MTALRWEEIVARFDKARNWWVGTAGPNGPHAVPVWGVALGGTLSFYGDPTLVRSRNLAADPRLVLHLEDGEDPLILHGRALATGLAQDRPELTRAYERKYRGPHDADYLLGTPYADGVLAYDIEPHKALAWTVAALDDWTVRRWKRTPPESRPPA